MPQGETIYSEDELVFLLQQGSKEGFDYLYKHYSGALWTSVCRIIKDEATAEDVLQEAFVKIWKNIGSYAYGKGRLYTWMSRIVRNCAIDKLRSKGETMKTKSQSSEEFVSNIRGNYSTENFTDAIGLKKVLSELPDKYLVIVELAYFKGYTMEECGTLLEIPVGTVKTRMRMALSLLREKLSIN